MVPVGSGLHAGPVAGPASLSERHTALKPEVLDRLLKGIGAAIDEYGGSFVMRFETVLITATRLG